MRSSPADLHAVALASEVYKAEPSTKGCLDDLTLVVSRKYEVVAGCRAIFVYVKAVYLMYKA